MPRRQIRCKLGQNIDYCFWFVCFVEFRKNLPNSLPELVNAEEKYTANLNKEQIITAVNYNNILQRAQAGIESDRGAFEFKLKYFRKRFNRSFFLLHTNFVVINYSRIGSSKEFQQLFEECFQFQMTIWN